MLNITQTIKFYEDQSASCVKRVLASDNNNVVLKYSILAELYLAIACGIKVMTVGRSLNEGPEPPHKLPDLEATDDKLRCDLY